MTSSLPASSEDVRAQRSARIEAWNDARAELDAVSGPRRIVGVLKIVLPLVAVALIALLLIWPGAYQQDETLPLTFSDVDAIDDDLRMVSPRFVGSDTKDQPFIVTADAAVQDKGDPTRIILDELQADVSLEDGTWLSLSAAEGLYLTETQQLDLKGRVSIFSDIGYELHADAARVDLKNGSIESDTYIRGQGPLGEIEAKAMRVSNSGDKIIFTGGVKITLYPNG